jgi:hypothetical protein
VSDHSDQARFHAEASGAVSLYLIDVHSAARLNERANLGDHVAVRIMRGIGAMAARFNTMPKKPQCLTCDYIFESDADQAVLVCTTPTVAPSVAGHCGEWVVVAGLCRRCAESGASGKAIAAWRMQWPHAQITVVLA